MKELVFFVEEPSTKIMLEKIVPRLYKGSDIKPIYVPFRCNSDLHKNLHKRMVGYCNTLALFIVVRDQDQHDCKTLKEKLKAENVPTNKWDRTIIRISCHELESFYLGDLSAVERGLDIDLSKIKNKRPYQAPDEIVHAKETLKKITKERYSQVSGSRAIAPHLDINGNNKSRSFNMLLSAIERQLTRLSSM